MNRPATTASRDLSRRLIEAEATIAALLSDQVDAVLDVRSMVPILLSKAQASLAASEERFRTQAEALRKSEERTNFVLGSAGVGLWEFDLVSGDITWSPTTAALYGLPPEQVPRTAADFLALVHPDDREMHSEALASSLRGGAAFNVESRTLWPDGSVHWIEGRATVVRDTDGNPVRVLGLVMDIDTQRSLQDQLRQSQRMEAVGQLAAGVAHDFNNLLTSILLSSHFVLETLGAHDPRRSDLDEVVAAAQRASGLTHQLLAFGRQQLLQPVAVDVNALINGLLPMLGRLIREDVNLVAVLAPGLQVVRADAGQVEQVLMNLVINARDAMPVGGSVTIRSAQVELEDSVIRGRRVSPGSYVMFSVEDEGDGMTAETMARLFEPFYTTKARDRGTGLGLATAYGIITQSGGYISVESAPARGATFRVYLPCEERGRTVETVVVPEVRGKVGTETVLLVEDEDSVRNVMRRILERAGYGVLEGANPAEAESLFERHQSRISLLVTDVIMPGSSGPSLFKRLSLTSPALKVLYVSGYAGDEVLKQGHAVSGADLLQKPFTTDALLHRVRTILDGPLGAQ